MSQSSCDRSRNRGSWDNSDCQGTPYCPPRCPRFVDKIGRSLLALSIDDAPVGSEQLQKLYDSAAERTSGICPPFRTSQAISSWLDGLLAEGWNLVVLDGTRLVGHAVLTPESNEEPEFAVYVDPAFQGRGTGSEMLRHAIAHAAASDHQAVVMNIEPSNDAMRTIAKAHGFRNRGTSDQKWRGLISYRLDLNRSPIADEIELTPTR